MDRQPELIPYSKNINGGFEHNPAKRIHDFSDNHIKSKFKITENSYLGEETSKLVRHHSNQEKQTGNLKPAAIDIDLVSYLPCGWLATDRRGKPGKSIIHFQAKPVGETHQTVTKKRNLELEHEESINEPGKDPTKSTNLNKQYFCSSCNKEFGSYFAFGGHRAFHVREERKCSRYTPSWATLLYRQPPLPSLEIVRGYDCWWCKKSFCSRQGLAAHSRFCYKKRRNMLAGDCRKTEVNRNFDLNELPPEAFLLEEILRQR